MDEQDTGTATGWGVDPPSEDGAPWRWHAYGPRGTRSGEAPDRPATEAAAVAALAELEQPAGRRP